MAGPGARQGPISLGALWHFSHHLVCGQLSSITIEPTVLEPVRLEDRYERGEGRVFLSGVQALVRVLLDQHRADALAGRRTAFLASGYPGSPLAGFDRELGALRGLAAEHDIVHRPAVNEELGATAVWGSQVAGELAGFRYDGVVGVWYGKGPGLDRASDAIRQANFGGTDPKGGVLALCGDDPENKSSTIPSASESLLAALEVPVIVPGSVQEALDFGRHGIACSRASGVWTALKVTTAVADATATADVGPGRVVPLMPELLWDGRPYVHRPSSRILGAEALEMERTLRGARLELAKRYARVNGLNAIVEPASRARLGIVAAGTAYYQLWQALEDLGLAAELYPRLLKIGMLYPLDEQIVREFASGLDEVIVVEEKGPFLERLIKDALYGTSSPPAVVGKQAPEGHSLVPATGALSPDVIALAVGQRLLQREDVPGVRARLDQIEAVSSRPAVELGAQRMPFFCSGCPHNVSTKVPDGSIVGAGIGCHTMVMLAPTGRGEIHGLTQMGGEGAQWLGIAPFVQPCHFVQNIGDGTFHHSGSLAIRAAVAGGLNITYKLLYNGAVAMTGGQQPAGQMSVPAIARELEAEGVRRIIITTEDRGRYSGVELPAIAELNDRHELDGAQRELAGTEGVTVLIHDQACATELRRARKRGTAQMPSYRVMINERVCEGCGDCGEKSSCLSLEPVQTEFGRKTRIEQGSCNVDGSCIEGDCPSFIRVTPPDANAAQPTRTGVRTPGVELPEPPLSVPADDVRIRLVGIGGTGVVTVSQVLGVAAMLDGRHAAGLDQTGLSQKAGPVVSDVRLSKRAARHRRRERPDRERRRADRVRPPRYRVRSQSRRGRSGPDGRDRLLGRRSDRRHGDRCDRGPTRCRRGDCGHRRGHPHRREPVRAGPGARGVRVRRSDARERDPARRRVAARRDPALARRDAPGVRAQPGRGRAEPGGVRVGPRGRGCTGASQRGTGPPVQSPPPLGRAERALVDSVAPSDGELRRLLEIRVADLVGWGGRSAARRYISELRRIHALEDARVPGSTALTEAVAIGLHKLMAYKDEYEVARLHVEHVDTLPDGSRVTLMLHPPLLRAIGVKRKLALGPWFMPFMRLLRHGRYVRGTRLDPFGYASIRRLERELPGEYLGLVSRAAERLSDDTLGTAVAVAQLPDIVRGYEQIKLEGVGRMRAAAVALMTVLSEDAGTRA